MKVILVGGFSEAIELAISTGALIVGVIDRSDKLDIANYNLKYLGNDDLIKSASFFDSYRDVKFFLCPDLPAVRKKLFYYYEEAGCKFQNIMSRKANISKTSIIEPDAAIMIQDLVNISANVNIKKGVRINTGANIMHDCVLEAFVTIAPNAVLLGRVKVGEGAYIGSNATILPGVSIGANAVVGAGAVVTKDISENDVVIGVPARKMNN